MTNELYTLTRQFDKAIVPVLRETPSAMSLLPLNTDYRGLGKSAVRIMGYASRGASHVGYEILQTAADGMDITGFDTKIMVIQDDATIKRTDWEAYTENGIPISSDIAMEMAGNNNALIDKIIYNGWSADGGTLYDVKGLYQVAGTSATGAGTDTFGNALKSVQAGITALEAQGVYSPGHILALHADQYSEVMASISTGVREYEEVLKALGTGGRIVKNSNLTATYGLIFPSPLDVNRKYFDIVETVPPMHTAWFKDGNTETGDIAIRQLTRLGVRFKHQTSSGTGTDVSVCKISSM
jgi:hypothetical protein